MSEIAKELLKQNGIDDGTLMDKERQAIRNLLCRDQRRVRILKIITLAGVAIIGCFFALAILLGIYVTWADLPAPFWYGKLLGISMLLSIPAVPITIVVGLLGLFLARSADHRALLYHLAEIEFMLRNPKSQGISPSGQEPEKDGSTATKE